MDDLLLGPVLTFRGHHPQEDTWAVRMLIVTRAAACPPVRLNDPDGGGRAAVAKPPALLYELHYDGAPARAFAVDIELGLSKRARTVGYDAGGRAHAFGVPASGDAPRIAYASCNGFSSAKVAKAYLPGGKDKYYNWRAMLALHQDAAYQLMILGGDQVYADSVLDTLNAHAERHQLSETQMLQLGGPELDAMLEQFYFNLYLQRWRDGPVGTALASIPAMMMWDDHDIVDGWGSLAPEVQGSNLYQAIHRAARRAFMLFQKGVGPDDTVADAITTGPGHSSAVRIGRLGILMLDLRSERTPERIIGKSSWDDIYAWVDRQEGLHHLLVAASIPVLHPTFHALEHALGVIPGTQEAEDDLRDHWSSKAHEGERLRLIRRLLAFAEARTTRVTIVSGDVHVAAHGVIEPTRSSVREEGIYQLTASGIMHPPPPGMVLFALNRLFEDDLEIDTWIKGRMLKFMGTTNRFIGARNWLSIEPNNDKPLMDLWAKWYVEGTPEPYGKVINASPLATAGADAAP